MYRFDVGTVPRTPVSSGAIATFFPAGNTIPLPLTSAMQSYIPAKVFFFGGPPGNRSAAIYSFNTMSTTFLQLGFSKILANSWNADVTASTMYYFSNNGSTTMFAFNQNDAIQTNPNLAVGTENEHYCGMKKIYIDRFCEDHL